YAGASGLVLPSTPGHKKAEIMESIDRLQAGGSTNGASGIELAYKTATENFIKNGTNRVLLLTDGDFNVGTTNQGDLVRLIEEKAKTGTFLTVLGFGMGNIKDSTLEKLADKGNGSYGYIDDENEARKVFVEQIGGTLITIAKDVKIQVEFNPQAVSSYRLIGYENRLLKDEDFNDDTKDAGEIGAGHVVTALYEIVPAGKSAGGRSVDPLKYQKKQAAQGEAKTSGEMLTVKLRYKKPQGDKSKLLEVVVKDETREFETASSDFKFSAAVAAYAMVLRDSKHKGSANFGMVSEIVRSNVQRAGKEDPYRKEFLDLVEIAKRLTARS
ncbi:MAG: YfbK domain-containing protein, partial [Bdellovibrionia bacterium]